MKTFGGSEWDLGRSVQQTSDEGYIIVGYTDSYGAGDHDVWLIKTDASGHTTWTKTFGGTSMDVGNAVQQVADGGYIITGTTHSYGASSNVWLIKTDATGNEVWSNTFGGIRADQGHSVQQTMDGGYIIAGYTEPYGTGTYPVWLIKTDASGDSLWTKTFGGRRPDMGNSVEQSFDGGYFITGAIQSYGAGSFDLWLIKAGALGDSLWSKTFGGSEFDAGTSVKQTSDGGSVMTGATSSYGAGSLDIWLIKTDASGETMWTKTYGGIRDEWGESVQQTDDEGYIIAGISRSFGEFDSDVWLIKTDAAGDSVWSKRFGGTDEEWGYSVQQTCDGGYVITGYTGSYGAGRMDVLLIKTDSEGNAESFD